MTTGLSPAAAAGRYGIAVLWLAIGLQLTWLLLNAVVLHRHPSLDLVGAVILVVVLLFAVLQRRWRWPAVLLRVVMAADFLLAVADRFGLLGAPGHAGVSWGDFHHFTAYTRTVIAFLPAGLAHPAAVAATIAEITLGAVLLLGLKTRLAAAGAGVLLACYATAMSISLPAAQQFHYNVILLCAAMTALATRGPAEQTRSDSPASPATQSARRPGGRRLTRRHPSQGTATSPANTGPLR